MVALNPAAGDHVYVDAPLAVSDTDAPVQIVGADGVTFTAGKGFTVTVTVAVRVQPLVAVPATV